MFLNRLAPGCFHAACDVGGGFREMNPKHTVLVVDDDAVQRALLARILDISGYHVLTAANGREALTILKQKSVEVIVTDVDMPEMSGIELVREVKEHPVLGAPLLGVVILSGLEIHRDEALGLGVSNLIFGVKPIDVESLLEKFSKFFR
ncbi:MAG: response regulator [Deltaproteobacteria bacterium]|nr:MAG: response regulator [Deltaproteobacteria bacterium]